MPPYNDLDVSAKTLVDDILHYDIIAEKCAAYLRQHDEASISGLWESQQAVFLGDRVTYPSMVTAHNTEGKKQFREKCEALCFPVGSKRPLQDYIMMYFAAVAGIQLAYKEAAEYPHRSDLCRIANHQSAQIHSDQVDQDSAHELNYNVDEAFQDPAELIDEKIRCRDNSSGKIINYVVVDYMNSLIGGDFFLLEDQYGRRYDVTPQELQEMRVD